jgi:hypothetical protein
MTQGKGKVADDLLRGTSLLASRLTPPNMGRNKLDTSEDKWQICNGKNYDERQITMKCSLKTPVTHQNIDLYLQF